MSEATYFAPADVRALVLPGMPADRGYTFEIRAYRKVDADIAPGGVILSPPVTSDEYVPSETVAFDGDITGTIQGRNALQVVLNLENIASDSVLSTSEKPQLILTYNLVVSQWLAMHDKALALGQAPDEVAAALDAKFALDEYLGDLDPAWDDTTKHTPIDKGDFQAAWESFYVALADLQAAIQGTVGEAIEDIIDRIEDVADIVDGIDIDFSDIQDQIDDLILTYGSTASAAASAALAESYKNAAAGSVTSAAAQVDLATGASEAAKAFAVTARLVAAKSLPSSFEDGGRYWVQHFEGADNRDSLETAPIEWVTFPDVAGVGKVAEVGAPATSYRDLANVGSMRYVAGRKYRARARVRTLAGTLNTRLYIVALKDDYTYNSDNAEVSAAVTTSWTELVANRTTDFAAGTVYIRAVMRVESGTGSVQWHYCELEDITESSRAQSQAGVAEAAAATATDKAAAASTSAGLAATHAGTAATQAGIATDKAVVATDSAAAAQASAVLSASIGPGALNRDPGFDDYTSTAVGGQPNQWAHSTSGWLQYRVADPQGGWAVRIPSAAGENAWVVQNCTSSQSLTYNGYYVMEADVVLHSGTFAGAGVLVSARDQTGGGGDYHLRFSVDPDVTGVVQSSPTTGRAYSFRKLFKVILPNPKGFYIYAMSHWATLGSIAAANDVEFRNVRLRPATMAEIRDQTVLAPMQVTVSETSSALLAIESDIATIGARWGVDIEIDAGDGKPWATGIELIGTGGSSGIFRTKNAVNWNKGPTHSVISGNGFGTNGDLMFWIGPNPTSISAATKANAVLWFDTAGNGYFGGSLRAGTLTSSAQTGDTSATASVSVTTGSDGAAIAVLGGVSLTGDDEYLVAYEASEGTPYSTSVAVSGGFDIKKNGTTRSSGTFAGTIVTQHYWLMTSTPGLWEHRAIVTLNASGSQTWTDSEGGTANRTYTCVVTSRSSISLAAFQQRVSISSVEE